MASLILINTQKRIPYEVNTNSFSSRTFRLCRNLFGQEDFLSLQLVELVSQELDCLTAGCQLLVQTTAVSCPLVMTGLSACLPQLLQLILKYRYQR
jgi:hypothetical protein